MGGRSPDDCTKSARGKLSTIGRLFAGRNGLYFLGGIGSGSVSTDSSGSFCDPTAIIDDKA